MAFDFPTLDIPVSQMFSELETNWKCNLGLYSKNSIFNLFHELGKMRSPDRATFKNSQNLICELRKT